MSAKFYAPGERGKNKSWVGRERIDGEDVETSIKGATDKSSAERLWDEFKTNFRYRSSHTPLTFKDAVDHYEATERRAAQQMNFARTLEKSLGDMALSDIRPGDIKKLGNELYPNLKTSSWNRMVIKVAGAVINHAAEDGLCHHIRIKKFKEEEVIKAHPSEGAGEILIANSEGYKRLYIASLHYQGLRPSEALRLSWEEGAINLHDRKFKLYIPKARKVKEIVMDDAFWLLLANVPKEDRVGPVFPWSSSKGAIKRWLPELCEKHGVEFGARKSRHKFASDLAAVGASEIDIMNNGSWTSPSSVKCYVTLNEDRARKMLKLKKKSGKKAGNMR